MSSPFPTLAICLSYAYIVKVRNVVLKTRFCFSAVYYFTSLFVACQSVGFFLQTLRMRSARPIISSANSWWAQIGATLRHCAAEPNARKRDARCAPKVSELSRHSARHTLETTEESLRLSFSLPRAEREVRSRIRRRTAASPPLVDKINMDFAAERSVTKDDLWKTETIAKYALKLRASNRANIVLAVALLSRLEMGGDTNWTRSRAVHLLRNSLSSLIPQSERNYAYLRWLTWIRYKFSRRREAIII